MKFEFAIAGKAYAAETAGETHASTEAGHGDAGHGGVFPPFDSAHFVSQLFWLALAFGAFYYFMSKRALPQIGSIIEGRRDRIAADIAEAGRKKDEADAAHAAYEHELASARGKAGSIGQAARDEAKAEADAERRRVEDDLAAKLAEAENRIAGIKATALAQVDTIAADTAETIVTELLGVKVTKAEIAAALGSQR